MTCRVPRARLHATGVAGAVVLAACTPSPEAARASRVSAYLQCARDAGVPVRDGTIVVRDAADIVRLDVCEAEPRR